MEKEEALEVLTEAILDQADEDIKEVAAGRAVEQGDNLLSLGRIRKKIAESGEKVREAIKYMDSLDAVDRLLFSIDATIKLEVKAARRLEKIRAGA